MLAIPSAASRSSSRGHDLLDEAPVVRGPGVDRVAGEVEQQRAPEPDEPRQALRAAAAGDEAELDLRLPELRVLRRDADVAAHRELEAAAEAEPVDRRDERRARRVHPRAELLDPARRAALLRLRRRLAERRELRDVRAGDEGAVARALEHDRAHARRRASSRSISASSSSSSGAESALTGGWSMVTSGDRALLLDRDEAPPCLRRLRRLGLLRELLAQRRLEKLSGAGLGDRFTNTIVSARHKIREVRR